MTGKIQGDTSVGWGTTTEVRYEKWCPIYSRKGRQWKVYDILYQYGRRKEESNQKTYRRHCENVSRGVFALRIPTPIQANIIMAQEHTVCIEDSSSNK